MKLFIAATLVASIVPAVAIAQEYPIKPIRMLVGFAPGGAADIIGRIVAQRLTESMKQTVVVDNRAGASGIIATEMAARAAPDGYTVLVGTMTTHAIAPSLYKSLPYDAVKDFAPVVLLGSIPLVMSISGTLPAGTVKEFVALAKAAPGKYTYATAGNGTPPHLAGELFKLKTGIDLVHVPYKGTAPAVADLVSGQVSITIDGVAVQVPHVKSGKLRALATATEKRLAALPDVPTFAEQGYSGLEMSLWYGLFAPGATPRPVVSRLNTEISRILALPDVRQRFADLIVEPGAGSPEQFSAFIQTETKRWAQVVQQANVKVD